VHRFTRHLRGLLVALATLALSAGVALAAHPTIDGASTARSVDGTTRVTDTAGTAVTVGGDEDQDANGSDPKEDEDTDVDDDQAAAAPAVDQAVTGGTTADTTARKQNHGWFVSEAAHAATAAAAAATTAATPGSHGVAVSTIARSDVGKPAAATAAAAAKAAKPAKAPKTSH
jgi:hypothetical protein